MSVVGISDCWMEESKCYEAKGILNADFDLKGIRSVVVCLH